jgi:hypothetical protein
MGSCCQSCADGGECSGKSPKTSSAPPDLITLGPDPEPPGVIEPDGGTPVAGDDDAASWPGRHLRPGAAVAVNTRLMLADAETTASDALALGKCTGGSVDLVLFAVSSLTTVEAILEGTIDGENFSRISSTVFSTTGSARFRFRNRSYRLVRIYYTASGSPGGVGIVATTINGSRN